MRRGGVSLIALQGVIGERASPNYFNSPTPPTSTKRETVKTGAIDLSFANTPTEEIPLIFIKSLWTFYAILMFAAVP